MAHKWNPTDLELLQKMLNEGKTYREMSELTGLTASALEKTVQRYRLVREMRLMQAPNPAGVSVQKVPTANRSIIQLLEDQKANFERKGARHTTKNLGIEVLLSEPGPYGLMMFGDPHVDDNGCDIEALIECLKFASETPHVYAANLGDLTNNWIGNLMRLYAHQNSTDDEGVVLMEWLLTQIPWVFVVLGNHDKWGPVATMMCVKHNITHVSHGAKFLFRDSKYGVPMVVDARHTHPGHSMYNPSHGQLKKNYRGSDADVIVAGHTHTSGYTMVKNEETGKIGHCIRVGAFKKFDDYADQKGYGDGAISPSVLLVVNPDAENPASFVTVFHDMYAGRVYLNALRAERETKTAL